ncbi:putative Cystatin domain-containing protein [Helianthus annuus]|uniref:Cystatin domain-containing protein n=1 Tax=Helianthus annuus TaxID=4232 RepID=A0A251S807_HELAN|nr:putative Cystatin domain-containing protein [Helianthus annuus]KAJ0450953.1 putative Cystatin domain-containing protein [Helianthus annuus]KAJ0455307.1 putative Cystatin domain-containing protein [Helianthus annuus]KAJ0472812.1 putative Cystatin domain-containing protein [Helianthus annuus]KAJ0648420.1 putative Cystatin domain-containing protein [Helianthus annuus]
MCSSYQALRFTILTFFSVSIFFNISVASVGKTSHDWTPIKNLSNPEVAKAGKYAVTEHNLRAHTSLAFVRVVDGKIKWINTGVGYKLTIAAKNDNTSWRIYVAVVDDSIYMNCINCLKLKSFKGPIGSS